MKFAIVNDKVSPLFGKRVMLGHYFKDSQLYDIFEPYGMLLARGVSQTQLAIL